MRTRCMTVLMVVGCLASCAFGADDPPKIDVEMKIYDVHSLVNPVVDYPGPDLNLGASPVSAAPTAPMGNGVSPKATVVPTVANIVDMLKSRVRPESWDPALGTSVEEMSGYLVIMQRPEVHALITQLLAAFSNTSQRQVVVKSLLIPAATIPDETFFDDAELNKAFDGNAAAAAVAAPRISCFNKQRVYVLSGTMVSVVRDLDVNGDSYDPVVTSQVDGFVLDVRPTVSYDSSVTELELRASFNTNLKRNPRTLGTPASSALRSVAALAQEESSSTTTKKENGHDEVTASSRRPAGQILNAQYLVGIDMDFPSVDSGNVRTELSIPTGKWVLAATLNNPDAKSPKKNMLLFVSSETIDTK